MPFLHQGQNLNYLVTASCLKNNLSHNFAVQSKPNSILTSVVSNQRNFAVFVLQTSKMVVA